MQQLIYLEAEDDLPAIRHLLEGVQAGRVALVLPRAYTVLRDPLKVRVLHRQAASLALDVALVTRDARTRQAARNEGLGVVFTVWQGQHGRWRSGAPRRSAARHAAEARIEAVRSGKVSPGTVDEVIKWAGRALAVLLFFLLLAVVVVIAALAVPEARITVVPYSELVDVTLELRADPQVEKPSLEKLTIPARLVQAEIEQTDETATMATRDAPADAAMGSVIFTNETATLREILPGAVVRTSTGTTVRFKTVTTATLEARVGATAVAEIEALEPGPVGNVPAATINVVETAGLRGKVRVINENRTSGGSVHQVGVVTRADMDRLKGQLLQKLQQSAYQELKNQLAESEFLPPESMTVEILSEVYDQFLDAQADVLHVTMRIYAMGTVVDAANANLLTFQAMKERIPPTYELRSEEIAFVLDPKVQMDGRSVLLSAAASVPLVTEIRPKDVRDVAAGLPADEAIRALDASLALAEPPTVEVGPEWTERWKWLRRVPYLGFRIQVVVLK